MPLLLVRGEGYTPQRLLCLDVNKGRFMDILLSKRWTEVLKYSETQTSVKPQSRNVVLFLERQKPTNPESPTIETSLDPGQLKEYYTK